MSLTIGSSVTMFNFVITCYILYSNVQTSGSAMAQTGCYNQKELSSLDNKFMVVKMLSILTAHC